MKKVLSVILAIVMMISVLPMASITVSASDADDIVSIARGQIGSYGSDSNKFTSWYYGKTTSQPWCAVFVSWCANQIGVLGDAIPKRASCASMLEWFQNRGEYYSVSSSYVPQKGDIIFFDTDGSGVTHHVEIVAQSGFITENGKTKVRCIGGNTSDASFSGSDYVSEKNRYIYQSSCKVMGYAHPSYDDTTDYSDYTYSFTFNANGGTLGSSGAFSVSYGEQFQVLNTTCTRSGYTWAGWNVKRNNDNKWYVAGQGWCTESQISSNGYIKKVYPNYKTLTFDDSWTSGITGDCSYTFYAVWIQSRQNRIKIFMSPYGQDCDYLTAMNNATGTGYTQNHIYAWYVLYDGYTGALLNTYQSSTYSVELKIYDPNGELVHSYNYTNSSDANWIGIAPQMSGTYTATATISGDLTGSVTTTYEVSYDAELLSSYDAISLNLNGTNSRTSTITIAGNYPGSYGVRYSIDSSSIASATWGGWNGNSTSITVTGNKVGTTNMTISLYENYTGNKNVIKTITIPITVTATYTISYNANGGSGAPSSQTKYYGTDITLSSTVPTRSGYTFLGWATSSTATSATYQPGATYSSNSAVTLYAVWKANATYSVTYDANGGSGAPSTQTGSTNYTISSTVPTRFGYTFLGWSTSSGATTSTYEAGDTIAISGNLTLYAVWKSATTLSVGTSYSAKIDFANQEVYYAFTPASSGTYTFESTGSVDSKVYVYNASGSELDNDDDSSDEGTNFKLTMNLTGGTKYYIKVRAYSSYTGTISFSATGKYTVTYNANGGSGAPANQTKTHGTTLTLSTAAPSRSGYTFKGWATSSTATSATYQPGGTYSSNANITLYAVWEGGQYTISYNANGGSGAPSNQTKARDVNLTLSSTKPTRTGYTFVGWSTSSTATSAAYQPGSTFSSNANTTLYAVWKANTYTVRYNANAGSGTMSTSSHTYDTIKTLSLNTFTRNGYTFLGWSTNLYATTATYTNGQEVKNLSSTNGEIIELYAVWQKKTVSAISISSPPTKTVYYVGDDLNTSGLKIKVTYTDGTYEDITSGNGLSMSYNMTIVGTRTVSVKLEGKSTTFNITIKAPTITLSEATKTIIVDDIVTVTATTDPAGQTVIWSSSDTNVATVVDGVVTAKGEGNATITAKFTYNGKEYSETCDVTVAADTYTVSYNANGGGGAPSSQIKTYGVSLTLSNTVPTRTGYTFLGWSTSSTATSATYQPSDSFTVNANTTLYAVWKQGCENGTHNYSYMTTKAPTTSATGTLTGTCSKCSGTTTVTLPKLNTTDYSYSVRTEASCTEVGSGRYTWKTTTYGSFYFDVSISATGHTYTDKVTAPSCTAQGYTTHACSCGYNYKDTYTSATGHNYSNGSCTHCGADDPNAVTSGAKYEITDVTGTAGSTVEIYVSIANNPGIISLRNTISYDTSALELISVQDCGLLEGYTTPSATISSPYTLRWADSLATQNNLSNGRVVKLTFQIKDDVEAGSYNISVTPVEARNVDGTKVTFSGASATVNVIDCIVGDTDGDGEVSDWDAIVLNRYLAGWTVGIELAAADIDGDGEVSDWDAIVLERYLAGWTVELES